MRVVNAGAFRTRIFAWLTISLLVVMSLIISLTVASAVGTLLGNITLLWLIGIMAERQQRKQQKELERMQNAFLEMRQKEAERMQRYAKMES